MASTSVLEGYHGGENMPLGGYAALLTAYSAIMGGGLWLLDRRGRLPERLGAGDLVIVGIATHKLTRTITRDWVTAPLRAPFTTFRGVQIHGEVLEKSRGTGLRRAIGDLLTCPFCTGPWVAGALALGLAARPRLTRLIAGTFTAVTASDFLHRAYVAASSASQEIARADEARAEQAERAERGRELRALS